MRDLGLLGRRAALTAAIPSLPGSMADSGLGKHGQIEATVTNYKDSLHALHCSGYHQR